MLLTIIYSVFLVIFYFSSVLSSISFLSSVYFNDLLVVSWLLFTAICVRISSAGWLTSSMLYFFGIYQSFFTHPKGLLSLITSNLITYFRYITFNIRNIQIITYQIWVPLYRRGGYLNLLNSSRTRWHLSTSNNIFKNK